MRDGGARRVREVASRAERIVRRFFPGRERAEAEVYRQSKMVGGFLGMWTKGNDAMFLGMGTDPEGLERCVLRNLSDRLGMRPRPDSWEELEIRMEARGAVE